jgi:hypothetical protein
MIIRTVVFAALIALAACSPPAATTASTGKPGDAPPAAAQTSPLQPVADASGKPGDSGATQANLITPQFLLGRWGDNGDCTKDIVFNGDGTYRSYTGGVGQWQISGDTIVMSGAGGTFSLQMQLIDQDHLLLRNPDGSTGTSQRC